MVAKPCRICVLWATDEAPFFSFPMYPVLDILLSIPTLLNNSNTANVKIWDNLQDILSI